MLENEGSKLGTEMLDTQLSGQLSGMKGGLADAIAKQLERQMGLSPGPYPAMGSANNTPAPLSDRFSIDVQLTVPFEPLFAVASSSGSTVLQPTKIKQKRTRILYIIVLIE